MARGRPVSIVFYAINGRGLGHLTRLLAIARAARTLLEAADVPADLEIVTTSEASFIADDFPVYKLPSKTAVARAGAARDRYVQRAKLIVSNLVAAQSPDLLVLDTVPYGAFQEFSFLRSYARATAYVYRHLDARSAASDLVQRHLELFDRILIPDDEARAEGYPVPRGARRRVAFTGPVTGYEQAEAWDRARVRGYFGVEEGRRLVYVAAGGGGDGRDALEALVRAVAGDERNVVLAGYGPLHRGGCVYAKNVIPLLEGNVSRIFGGRRGGERGRLQLVRGAARGARADAVLRAGQGPRPAGPAHRARSRGLAARGDPRAGRPRAGARSARRSARG
ncbi:MAG: hypothetical protein IPG04_18490 [Polyangiaceae bacterium]|nr:hypothetical protein [Polyangiaceae bacterium]